MSEQATSQNVPSTSEQTDRSGLDGQETMSSDDQGHSPPTTDTHKEPTPGQWQRIFSIVKEYWSLLTIIPVLVFYMMALSNEPSKETRQDIQSSGDAVDENLLPHSSEQAQPSTSRFSLIRFLKTIFARLIDITGVFFPFLLYIICTLLILGIGHRPTRSPAACAARLTENGFVGNSDFYGLGVRLGMYLQWLAAIFAIRFLPSARKVIVGSYLFFQFGIIVALILLVLPSSCAFTAEISIILQMLFAGGALVLAPSQATGSKFDAKSKYLTIEIISISMGIVVYAIAAWFFLSLAFGFERNFADISEGTDVRSRSATHFDPRYQAFWIGFLLNDLFERYRHKANVYLFPETMDWIWYMSGNMATSGSVMTMNGIMRVVVFITSIFGLFFDSHGTEEQNASDDDFSSRIQKRATFKFMKYWYWPFRAIFVLVWSALLIEAMIERENICGVQSLNSTGQVMPLAIGIVTVLSVIYLWIAEFFTKGRASTESNTPVVLEQAIGLSTSSGMWR